MKKRNNHENARQTVFNYFASFFPDRVEIQSHTKELDIFLENMGLWLSLLYHRSIIGRSLTIKNNIEIIEENPGFFDEHFNSFLKIERYSYEYINP